MDPAGLCSVLRQICLTEVAGYATLSTMDAIIFIGIQASGKSEFYKQRFVDTHIRINLDMLKTRRREEIIVDACIAAKQPFVVDNTNPAKKDRKRYIDKAKPAGFKTIGYYFRSSVQESMERNKKRNAAERVPDAAIKATAAKLELPGFDEGFDELYYVRIGDDGAFVIEEYRDDEI